MRVRAARYAARFDARVARIRYARRRGAVIRVAACDMRGARSSSTCALDSAPARTARSQVMQHLRHAMPYFALRQYAVTLDAVCRLYA